MKRVKSKEKGGEEIMCLGREDVTGIVETAMKPILNILDDVQNKMEGVVKLALDQKELEGRVLNLHGKSKDREKFEEELFGRVRTIETTTEPRSSCSAFFNSLDKSAENAVKAIGALDKQIKDRTWAILVVLLGAFLSVMGSITVGLIIYFFKTTGP